MKFGLFYGSTTCYTEMAAEKIRDAIGAELVELHNVKETPLTQMCNYDVLILGISTWDFGELQEDWDAIWHSLDNLDLSGKIIALYGLGDQIGYGEWFLDAMGLLHDKLLTRGAQLIGYWPIDGYTFTASKALTADNSTFVGLALDEENQYELSDERIADWSGQILLEIEALL